MNIKKIAIIHSPFSDKFSIPRQSGLVQSALGKITLLPPFATAEAIKGMEMYSHLWLLWGFHQHQDKAKSVTVRPPRLGGNTKMGVFATRSPFRPNNLGISVCKIEKISYTPKPVIHVSGIDCLDQTPVYDIKPYIPYSDAIKANNQWANKAPRPVFSVIIPMAIKQQLQEIENQRSINLIELIQELLQYDMRPAYHQDDEQRCYGTTLYTVNIRWKITGNTLTLIEVKL